MFSSVKMKQSIMGMLWVGLLCIVFPQLLWAQSTNLVTFKGQIIDVETNQPISIVQVLVNETQDWETTDDKGFFQFNELKTGTYHLKIVRIGYVTEVFTVNVTEGGGLQQLRLTPESVQVDEVVIVGEHRDNELSHAAANTVDGETLRENLGETIAETLKEEPGISMRSMGPAPARPILRGLGGERLLVLEDGGRTGDVSATSSDHAVTIESLTAQNIEVVRGPAALIYGSNSLGGVVNVKRGSIPEQISPALSGSLTLQGESVNRAGAIAGFAAKTVGPFTFRGDGSFRRTTDLTTPAGVLKNTDIQTTNGSVGISHIEANHWIGASGSLYKTSYGIPGGFVGAHPDGVRIEIERQHVESAGDWHFDGNLFDRIESKVAYSRFYQRELESSEVLGVSFGVLSTDFKTILHTKAFGPFSHGAVGVWGEYRDYGSGGSVTTPDATDLQLAGFFWQESDIDDWILQFGARYDFRRVDPITDKTENAAGKLETKQFGNVAGSIAIIKKFDDLFRIRLGGMRSVRLPGIEELFSAGPHLAAYSVEVGNANLDTEIGYGAELVATATPAGQKIQGAVFINTFNSFIYPQNTGTLDPRQQLPLYRQIALPAKMVGAELSWDLGVNKSLRLQGNLSYVRGTLTDTNEPLPFMPPIHVNAQLRYNKTQFSGFVGLRSAGVQNRLGEYETRTNGYNVIDLGSEYRLQFKGQLHTLTFSIQNLFNATYRDHLSRVKVIMPEAGRNARLFYRVYF